MGEKIFCFAKKKKANKGFNKLGASEPISKVENIRALLMLREHNSIHKDKAHLHISLDKEADNSGH